MLNTRATAIEATGTTSQGTSQSRANQSEVPLELDRALHRIRPQRTGTVPIVPCLETSQGVTQGCRGRNDSDSLFLRLAKRRQCSAHCHCVCHQQRVFRSPDLLHHVLGFFFAGFRGRARLFTNCDTETCLGSSKPEYHVLYMFPRWMLDLAIFTRLHMQGPEMLIRCLRVRPFGLTRVFKYLAHGHYSQVKSLMAIGQASVLDVDDLGRSLLHVSLNS